jgi:GT2 family glycosyltransferase
MQQSPPSDATTERAAPAAAQRPIVRGKGIFHRGRKLQVRGVTYGPFSSRHDGGFDPHTAALDFSRMAATGINAIRLYVPPEPWLLDLAQSHGLLVMVGIPWEQHIAFLDTGAAEQIEQSLRQAIAPCAGHPAVLCYAIGNEIPASIVRWHGRSRIERFLARLGDAAREMDPGALIAYVNFPPTEYLRLSTFDLVAFNVYLERRDQLEGYLARLQNIADDRPLLIAELGLDSRRNGLEQQAQSLSWQLESCASAGCAGTFVFAWTDEWHRGGAEILDWDFGLTTRAREPKPSLAAVAQAFAEDGPATADAPETPRMSVVICTYNGAATLRGCLEAVLAQDYPRYEVIVVSDGSSDGSAGIAAEYPGVTVVETPNRGLAAARNSGMEAAGGEIIAYTDDDAEPDPYWLGHLAQSFASGEHAAVGGPNVPPPDSTAVAQCVANAPGGPAHVLLADREAEHIPGCNMAIEKSALEAIGGFDPQFRAAGDDVDVCWRLLDSGRRIAFNPGAVVLHHRRATVRGYLTQQQAYGRAEALLERKYPERYSAAGHVSWQGRLYGNGAAQHRGGWRWRVYYGGWGTAFYQSLYGPRNTLLESLPLMPEWYMAIAVLAVIAALGALWTPLLAAVPLLLGAVFALGVDAALGATRARFPAGTSSLRKRALTGFLYLAQPLARLQGRLAFGLTPWRHRGPRALALPVRRRRQFWCEQWQGTEERVRSLMGALHREGVAVRSGGDWDRWDLQVRGGLLGIARLRLAIEEHGGGRQLVRVAVWPRPLAAGVSLPGLAILLTALAVLSGGGAAAIVLATLAVLLSARTLYECGLAAAILGRVLKADVPDEHIDQSAPLPGPPLPVPRQGAEREEASEVAEPFPSAGTPGPWSEPSSTPVREPRPSPASSRTVTRMPRAGEAAGTHEPARQPERSGSR